MILRTWAGTRVESRGRGLGFWLLYLRGWAAAVLANDVRLENGERWKWRA